MKISAVTASIRGSALARLKTMVLGSKNSIRNNRRTILMIIVDNINKYGKWYDTGTRLVVFGSQNQLYATIYILWKISLKWSRETDWFERSLFPFKSYEYETINGLKASL